MSAADSQFSVSVPDPGVGDVDDRLEHLNRAQQIQERVS
jgi:hypothetical protein